MLPDICGVENMKPYLKLGVAGYELDMAFTGAVWFMALPQLMLHQVWQVVWV